MKNTQPITYKKILIQLLISQTAQILGVDITNQPSASESLRNVVEAMTFFEAIRNMRRHRKRNR